MSQLLHDRQRQWIERLFSAVKHRSETETAVETAYRTGSEQSEKQIASKRKSLSQRRDREMAEAEKKLHQVQRAVRTQFETDSQAADKEVSEGKMKATNEFEEAEDKARSALQEAEWTATSFFEAEEKESFDSVLKYTQRSRDAASNVHTLWKQTEEALARGGLTTHDVWTERPARCTAASSVEAARVMDNAVNSARQFLDQMEQLMLPKLLGVAPSAVLFVGLCVVLSIPAAFFHPAIVWLIGGLFAAAAAFALIRGLMKKRAIRQMLHLGDRLARALELAEDSSAKLKQLAEHDHEKHVETLRAKHDREIKAARAKHEPHIDSIVERKAFLIDEIVRKHESTKTNLQKQHDRNLQTAQEDNWSSRAAAETTYSSDLAEAEAVYNDRLTELKNQYDHSSRELINRWRHEIQALRDEYQSLRTENDRLFPSWDAVDWSNLAAATDVPAGIRLGDMPFDLEQIPGGVSTDARLKIDQPLSGLLPAFAPFPDRCSVMIKTRDQGRGKAVSVIQAAMLRFLSANPPGKTRFTIIDPVGLGDNFAAFMHLADYDEQLVSSRIWTEPVHIEQRLSDITAHMENVIQKYLRHQFKSIVEYNAAAGEVAEPFRVLVVANFPTNFTADAARRLVSIATSGSSCGVYTLISVDARQPMPHGFNLNDLELPCLNIVWENETFAFRDETLSRFPLQLDSPPDAVTTSRLVHRVGSLAKQAARVEVPFEFVAPKPEEIWKSDSRDGVSVPIGRMGATKRQFLQLGKGTSQHGLIAGKTGSGKSTLLHALITNLSLCYSPDEVELYLIDFKKGVEFKPYADHHLPQARVIAIESEREFGLSVLQRLDTELKVRGERYRQAGVNDVKSFRDERPGERMPRILLIVDEFQEFFTEDDKLAQESALLLDRLVRQGRAFGLHVILGSQTLGGAYSLARSTIDQMAVRIALQCSEADAHLILSKDNAAARLLSRPGEAIYNNQNGLIEGNDLFQVVWLPDERREDYLSELEARAAQTAKLPQLVFEGTAPGEIQQNTMLDGLLRASEWPANPRSFHAWLGEAIAIKDPTAATFRPQSGSHLLMIGQHSEAATSMLGSSLFALAAQHRPGDGETPLTARFHLLDGTPADDSLADFLSHAAQGLPHSVQTADMWGIAPMLSELAELVNARQARTATDHSTRYLIINGIQRFRDLRRSDDDFGFRKSERASPAENFALILRDGPTVGVHLLVWCDTLTNVNRSFDRTMLRECTQRVLFQMSATDSSHLIDSPAASRLGRNRALFHREEQDVPEKFRPYGLPSAEWMAWAKERLHRS